MCIIIRNDRFWQEIPTFIVKHFDLPTLGIKVLGYFPYHTAKIQIDARHGSIILLPRTLFNELENLLILNNVCDNKAVYICKPLDPFNATNFAIMLKDSYAIIGSWERVINYDGKPFKL
jgi:hypothetical protein